MVHLSPPDRHGFCSLGTSVDVAKAAVDSAQTIIAQINQQMPRVHGDDFIHLDNIDRWIEVNEALPEATRSPVTEIEKRIGQLAASLIENGSSLQVGIGSVPDAVLSELMGHKNLGLHSEMWSDGALDLLLSGTIDNSQNIVHPGKSVSTFIFGSRRVYDYIHDNPSAIQLEASYVNSANVIVCSPILK